MTPSLDMSSPQDDGMREDVEVKHEAEQKEATMASLHDLLAGKEATVINVPFDMTIEQAIAAFDHKVYSCIRVKNGMYDWEGTMLVEKEVHIVGDDNVKLAGRWHFNDRGVRPSTIKNCGLFQMGSEKAKEYCRTMYVTSGEVRLTDCQVLSPGAYGIWAAAKGTVQLAGCILAGNADGTRKSYGGIVVMGRSTVNIVDCQVENCEEFCVMVDNDAIANISNCVFQATEVAIITSDRASVACGRCTLRLLTRGAFGHLKGNDGRLLFKESVVYGDMWARGMPARPGRLLCHSNDLLEPIFEYQ